MSRRPWAYRELRVLADDGVGGETLASGRYITGTTAAAGTGSVSELANRLLAGQCFIRHPIRIDRIGVNVTTAIASGSVRLGIYESLASGLPGSLILDAGTIDAATTGFKEITIDQALDGPRMYWTALVHNDNTIIIRGRINAGSIGHGSGGGVDPDNTAKVTHTFGALPDSFAATSFLDRDMPAAYLRVV